MSSKENYQRSDSSIVKRSPAVSGRNVNKSISGSALNSSLTVRSKCGYTSRSISQNINSLEKVLKESDKIMPRSSNNIKKERSSS